MRRPPDASSQPPIHKTVPRGGGSAQGAGGTECYSSLRQPFEALCSKVERRRRRRRKRRRRRRKRRRRRERRSRRIEGLDWSISLFFRVDGLVVLVDACESASSFARRK